MAPSSASYGLGPYPDLNTAAGASTPGVNPGVMEGLRSSVEERMKQLGPMVTELKTKAKTASANLEKRPLGRMSTLGTAGLMATGQAMQGDVMGALSQGLGGLGGGAAASAMVRNMRGPLGVAARIGAPIIGAMAGGNMLEAITGGLGAKAKETTEPLYFPGTNIPITKGAEYENIRNRDLDYILRSNKALGEQERALTRQGMQDQLEMKIQLEKAMVPLQEQINRSNLVNAQAKLASEGAMYQALGRQAGQYKLAGIDRTETGATLRTAISVNPYMGATLSAPSISFG